MQTIKEQIKKIGQKWLIALPTIVVSLILFFSMWNLFGIANVIMPPFLTLIFKIKHTQDFHLKELLKMYIVMIFIAFMSFVATVNIPFAIILNLVIPFLLVIILTNKFNPKSYFIYGMEFVMLQLMPIKFSEIPLRIVALLYSFLIITIALYLNAFIVKRKRHYGTVRKGLKTISTMLVKLTQNIDVSKENSSLSSMMYHMSYVVYSSRNYSYLINGYGKNNYLFMMAFQRFHYFFEQYADYKWRDDEKNYLIKLSDIFLIAEKQLNTEDNSVIIQKITELKKEINRHNFSFKEPFDEILTLIVYSLEQIQDTRMYKSQKSWKMSNQHRKIKNIKDIFNFDIFQLRFALRLSLVLGVSFAFCRISSLDHSYWYPMTSFFMLMPYSEESSMKIKNRILGTMAGVSISFILMSGLKTEFEHIIIIVLCTCFMYYVPVTSWTMPMYTTCFAMSLATIHLSLETAFILRITYVLLASVTTILANKFLLPNTAKSEFKNSLNQLFDIDLVMIREIRRINQDSDRNILRSLVLHSALLTNDIEIYVGKNIKKNQQDFFNKMLKLNRRLVNEMEQLSSYLYDDNTYIKIKDNKMLEELFSNFEKIIENVRKEILTQELSDLAEEFTQDINIDNLTDKIYFNTLAINCANTLKQFKNLSLEAVKK